MAFYVFEEHLSQPKVFTTAQAGYDYARHFIGLSTKLAESYQQPGTLPAYSFYGVEGVKNFLTLPEADLAKEAEVGGASLDAILLYEVKRENKVDETETTIGKLWRVEADYYTREALDFE